MSKFIDNMTYRWDGVERKYTNKRIFSELATQELTIECYKIYKFDATWHADIRVPVEYRCGKLMEQESESLVKQRAKNLLRNDIYSEFLGLLYELDTAIFEEKYDDIHEINNKIRDVVFGEQEQ